MENGHPIPKCHVASKKEITEKKRKIDKKKKRHYRLNIMFDLKKNNFGTLKIRKKYIFTHTKPIYGIIQTAPVGMHIVAKM